ncbi:uncharacterized protein LOC127738052 [Mytilus californianus]|uniref:uncharacterized protein LOC127738052 n=1 Tax=Mytilus californianus TaxID=6549 RepID=UPI002245F3BE|nr:uncharacterized protein LOC127738052 [Mytilus californianus]
MSGFYGHRCTKSCECLKNERCESSQGCVPNGGDEYKHTTRRNILSTTDDMNSKDSTIGGTTFLYKEILMITIPCVVIALVIAIVTKRAHHHCKIFEVSSIAENSQTLHVEANETGIDNDIEVSENITDFSAKDSWSSFDSIISESDGCLPVEIGVIQTCNYSIEDIYQN